MPVMPAITSNFTTSSTTQADITNLNFPVIAGRTYYFKFYVLASTTSATVGAGFAVNTPGSDTIVGWTVTVPTTSSAMYYLNPVTNAGGDAPEAGNSANLASTGGNFITCEGFVKPATTGSIALQAETESGTLTVYAGSFVEYRDLLA